MAGYSDKLTAIGANASGTAGADGLALQRDSGAPMLTPVSKPGGLPCDLQAGLESLSGQDLSDVNVNYNSSRPAKFGAHAVAQGNNIDLGPGQEKHLPHEAWHVVQQRQGRVPVTGSMGDTPVNTNPALETEADQMGAKAAQMKMVLDHTNLTTTVANNQPVQMKTEVLLKTQKIKWERLPQYGGKETDRDVGRNMRATLDWSDPRSGSTPGESSDIMHDLRDNEDTANAKFIKGHLLNDHLGGLGIWKNMFPITSNANLQHLANMERYAKQYLLDAEDEDTAKDGITKATDNEDKHIVHYNVDAVPDVGEDGDFLKNPKSTLACSVFIKGPDISTKYHKSTIVSDPEIHVGQNESLVDLGWVPYGSGSRSGDNKVSTDKAPHSGKVTEDGDTWSTGKAEYYQYNEYLKDMSDKVAKDPSKEGIAEALRITGNAGIEWNAAADLDDTVTFLTALRDQLSKKLGELTAPPSPPTTPVRGTSGSGASAPPVAHSPRKKLRSGKSY